MKRYLYLAHRWLGIVLCAFMAMWFVSGVVMMYVGYPKLTPAERLARLPDLRLGSCCVDLSRALRAGGLGEPQEVRLTTIGGIPHYVLGYDRNHWVSVDAHTGRVVSDVSSGSAIQAASAFAGEAKTTYLGTVEEDAWTHSRALDPHRPLHRVRLEDKDATVFYVSNLTGEVVRDATRSERMWGWVGAWIHWLYPIRGGVLDKLWRDTVIWLSLAGTILAVTGAVVGVQRLRVRRRYAGGRYSPYRDGFMRWHHLLGLAFCIVTIAWIFSGLISVNPWQLFSSPRIQEAQRLAYSGGPLSLEQFALSPGDALARVGQDFEPREIVWQVFDGKPFYLLYDGAGRTLLLEASRNDATPQQRFQATDLIAAARRLKPETPVVGAQELTHYDIYYYARAPHTMTGHMERRLPVLRVKFGDAADTWVHIDPYTGRVDNVLDSSRRFHRWLFAALHSWDLPVLLGNRPLWDVLMIGLSAGGFGLSVTGIVIGWRRLRRPSPCNVGSS